MERAMPKIAFDLGVAAVVGILLVGIAQPASAERPSTHELVAQSRPRIVIHPRHRYLSPSAKRHCAFWLAKEIWPNGQPVITPQTRCWWQ
jgi:hypothetical protein